MFIVPKEHDIDLREEEKHSFIKSKLSSLIHKEGDFTWNNYKVSQLSYFTELGDKEVPFLWGVQTTEWFKKDYLSEDIVDICRRE